MRHKHCDLVRVSSTVLVDQARILVRGPRVCQGAASVCAAFIYRTAFPRIRRLLPHGSSNSLLGRQQKPHLTSPASNENKFRPRCCHRQNIPSEKSPHGVSYYPRNPRCSARCTYEPPSWSVHQHQTDHRQFFPTSRNIFFQGWKCHIRGVYRFIVLPDSLTRPKIDGTLYCVHRYFFSRDSLYFSTTFSQLSVRDYESLNTVISFSDVERKDFEAFLSVVYPM